MKAVITSILAFTAIIWGAAYASEVLKDVHGWWVVPAFATALGSVAFGILFAGMWWDGVFRKK